MGLKQHIGILVMMTMALTVIWAWRDDLRDHFSWYTPTGAAFIVWVVCEAFWQAGVFFFWR